MACCCGGSGGGPYCCWDKDPALPLAPGEAAATTSCQSLPCTGMSTNDFTLFSAGPYADSSTCSAQCGGFNCTGSGCVPAGTGGEFRTKQECDLVCCSTGYPMEIGRFTGIAEAFSSNSFNSSTAYHRGFLRFPVNRRLRFILYYWNGGGSSTSTAPYCPIRWTVYMANYDSTTGVLISPRVELFQITCGDLSQPCTFGGASWTSTPGCGFNGFGARISTKPASANCLEVEIVSPGGLMGWRYQAYCDANAAP